MQILIKIYELRAYSLKDLDQSNYALQKVIEYDQKKTQSHNADQPTTP